MTKIDIFSGFLGAGKTTLIKKLIDEAFRGEKLVLIENEFGEIGIDGGFLKEAGIEITEMNSGCICCSLVGDFGKALKEVIDRFHPERILIEPSGVGKLSDVIKAVRDLGSDDIVLNSFTTVVDAKKCRVYMKNFGEFFNNQVENAGCIVLSHTKGLDDGKIAQSLELLREHNPSATVITTDWDEIDGGTILDAMENTTNVESELRKLREETEVCPECGHVHHHEHHHGEECDCHEHHHYHDHGHEHHHEHGEECGCRHHHDQGHHHHHADEVFQSWGIETAAKFTTEKIETALSELGKWEEYGQILRAKGIVSADGEWIYFDYIPGDIDIRRGKADVIGRICVIGSKIDEDAIKELFS